MTRTTSALRTVRLASDLLRYRLGVWYAAHVLHDPTARLVTRAGREDPYPVYEEIRAHGPLLRSRVGRWVTVDHRIADQILRDRRFGVRSGGYTPPPDRFEPALGEGWDPSFLALDPPDHTRLRRLAAPAFTPKRIAGYRDRIERATDRLVDRALARAERDGRFDLMAHLAAPLPISVIAELLGLPETDVPRLARYGNALGASLDGIRSLRHARELQTTIRDLQDLFADLVELRTREPGEDVVSRLVAGLGAQKLTPGELLQACALLLVAGFETTVNLIGNGVRALLDHPEQWALLREDPGLAPRVVEEVLRYDSPVQLTERIAKEDVELAGKTIRRDRSVLVLLGAAGRDPRVFDEPDRFDITRERSAEHLAFSSGVHYCLGAPLARLEGAVMFRAIAERLPGLQPAGRVRRRTNVTLRGIASFPVRLDPASSRPARLPAHPASVPSPPGRPGRPAPA